MLKRTVQTGFDRETGKPIYEDEVLELEPCPTSSWWWTKSPT